jgi:3-oxoadipate enol-lactonase
MNAALALRSAQHLLGDFRTDVVRSGSGAGGTVLALHSLGLDGHAFDALRDVLAPDWVLVSYDQRGHGGSADQPSAEIERYVEDALAALALCGDGPVHLLGHSMGGAVAALLASTLARVAPGRVASLTLVATPAGGGQVFSQRAADVMAGGMSAAIRLTMARWFGETRAPQDAPAQAYARAALARMPAASFSAAWQALAQFPGYADIAHVLPPTLCIAIDDDLSTPPAVMRAIVDAFAAAGRVDRIRFTTLAAGGHMAPLAPTPELVASLEAHWRAHAVPIALDKP